MYHASKELTEQLHQLSGWEYDQDGSYSLSLMLRKLQEIAPTLAWMHDEQKWAAITDANFERQDADIPENALCKLAIELWKQGALK